ncbi:MAG TPA: cytochrome c3 family protein, partial [Thermohalobaculum sp.]|nr:cytochrome c3 family protein [Thermohalobaculum sp.]
SCHDGSLAIGTVNVSGGQQNVTFNMTGTGTSGEMPAGAGLLTGYTRNLGTDLTNDHPISFSYTDALALQDGELRLPSATPEIDNRVPGVRPEVPLIDDQLQCTACHDPHIRDTVEANIKFLRLNRFQASEPQAGAFIASVDQICLACHEKEGWVGSAHASSTVADEIYSAAAAAQREFPSGQAVWKAGCLNCHDTHTVEGARRLLREGTDSIAVPKSGGNSAIEETCYQCHSSTGGVLVGQGGASFPVPDIRTDFQRLRHMPIDANPEVHDIGTGTEPQPGKDFLESRGLLGRASETNRHAECTDCHNPHRVIKNRRFNALPDIPDAAGTHDRSNTSSPDNIASGVLRGAWGVEPVYGSAAFLAPPVAFDVKRGTPPTGGSTAATATYVTREYQICLKCHSEYGYVQPPLLGLSFGGTPFGTNDVERYTDQAMEFQAPIGDRGNPGGNHRSWHPVMAETGRTTGLRSADANNWLEPFNDPSLIGSQTMYCSDCHGSSTANGTILPSGGENGNAWGPHGSNNDFILKGQFDQTTGTGQQDDLCFKCHSYTRYATRNGSGILSGFGGSRDENLHGYHADKIGQLRCTWCHVAVPHGWKNKGLLVNLNDVGAEAGLAAGTQVRNNTTAGYTNGPYYLNAMLKVITFATSGNWEENNCGSSGAPGNGETGRDWMRDSNENCENPP